MIDLQIDIANGRSVPQCAWRSANDEDKPKTMRTIIGGSQWRCSSYRDGRWTHCNLGRDWNGQVDGSRQGACIPTCTRRGARVVPVLTPSAWPDVASELWLTDGGSS